MENSPNNLYIFNAMSCLVAWWNLMSPTSFCPEGNSSFCSVSPHCSCSLPLSPSASLSYQNDHCDKAVLVFRPLLLYVILPQSTRAVMLTIQIRQGEAAKRFPQVRRWVHYNKVLGQTEKKDYIHITFITVKYHNCHFMVDFCLSLTMSNL